MEKILFKLYSIILYSTLLLKDMLSKRFSVPIGEIIMFLMETSSLKVKGENRFRTRMAETYGEK